MIITIFLCKHCKCGKSFISDTGLKRHELQHSSMDYKCTVCDREFAFESKLSNHKTIHLEEKHFIGQYPNKSIVPKTLIIKLMGLPVMITGIRYVAKHLTSVNIYGNTNRCIQENYYLNVLFVETGSNGEVGGIITYNRSTKIRKV